MDWVGDVSGGHASELGASSGLVTLVARASRGDDHAFTTLVRDITPGLRAWLVAHCPLSVDVPEIEQRTLIAVHDRLPTYRPAYGGLLPWVLGIARRELANEIRTQARRLRRQKAAASLSLLDDHFQDLETGAERPDYLPHLRRCLADLPPDRRQLIDLHYGERQSTRIIAEERHVPVGTIKKRLHLTREWLRRCIHIHMRGTGEEKR